MGWAARGGGGAGAAGGGTGRAGLGAAAGGWDGLTTAGGAGGLMAAGGAGGLMAPGGAGAGAFFTDRIVFPAAGAVEPLGKDWPRMRARMRAASSSLMELLWLRAAMASFSAASSTSLLSRPRSRDNS